MLASRTNRLMLSASPIQNDADSPYWLPAPNSTAATGSTTYISESPMITAAVGATAYTIPAGTIALMRIIGARISRLPHLVNERSLLHYAALGRKCLSSLHVCCLNRIADLPVVSCHPPLS